MTKIIKLNNQDKKYFHGQSYGIHNLLLEIEKFNTFEDFQSFIFRKKEELKLFNFALTCEEFVFIDGVFCYMETIKHYQSKESELENMSEETEKTILKMWRDGFNSAQCARYVNLEQNTIKKFLVKKGLLV